MKFLIDTHAIIWFITDDSKLPASVKNLIEDIANTCFVSVASLWEMAIKFSIGKLVLGVSLEEMFELIEKTGFELLSATPKHLLASAKLPFHHSDPFDRLMIAQAQTDNLTLVSRDGKFDLYEVKLLWNE